MCILEGKKKKIHAKVQHAEEYIVVTVKSSATLVIKEDVRVNMAGVHKDLGETHEP